MLSDASFFQSLQSVAPACTKSSSSDVGARSSASEAGASINPPAPSASSASPVPPPSVVFSKICLRTCDAW